MKKDMILKAMWHSGINPVGWSKSTSILVGCAVALLSVAAGACGSTGTTSPLGSFDAVVQGRVTTLAGEPLRGAHVLMRLYFNNCVDTTDAAPGHDFIQNGDRTDENGHYQILFQYLGAQTAECANVKVDLEPFNRSQEREADTTVAVDLHLRPRPPLDTATVNVTLER